MLKLAVTTSALPAAIPLRKRIDFAHELRVSGVVFDVRTELVASDWGTTALRDLRHLLRERGLSVAATRFPLMRPLWDEAHLEGRLKVLQSAIEFSSLLGSTTLCLAPGSWPATENTAQAQLAHEVLSDVARFGLHVGVEVALHWPVDCGAALREVLSRVTTGRVGLDFDPLLSQDASSAAREWHGLLLHAQLRDGYRDGLGQIRETPLGEGTVSWPALLASFVEIDYSGWLSATCGVSGDPASDLSFAVSRVRKWLPGGLR